MLELNQLYNMDCMEGMKQFPDKYFELAIVDPPYGIGGTKEIGVKKGQKESKWQLKEWDTKIPDIAYFEELKRVSQNQIIWGGNYFPLPPTRCFLIWDKVQRIDMADCEFAWTSFQTSARIYTYARSNIQGFRNPHRFHPTEKPVDLYKWLLMNYAKPGDKILDTHVGSASSLIACYDMGFDYIGFEIDEDYYKAAQKRIEENKAQIRMVI
jgi:site-specific DNA-methyltransferase (adenine-specific)